MIKKYENIKDNFVNMEYEISTQLNQFANDYLLNEYDLELKVPILINGRLSRAVGRFVSNPRTKTPVKIEISKKHIILALATDTFEDIIDTLKHELVHYSLFVKGLPYRDNDHYFIQECKRQDISLSHEGSSLRHIYECENGHQITSLQKFNTNRYICSCGSKLKYKDLAIFNGREKL